LDRATKYAESVVIGDVVAGKPHIQACQRHLNDRETCMTLKTQLAAIPKKPAEQPVSNKFQKFKVM
jgi:hypothetical protein